MKKALFVSAIAASFVLTACNKADDTAAEATAAPAAAEAPAAFDTNLQKVSYGIGLNIATNFKQQSLELDMATFNKGLEDGFSGAEPAIDQAAIMAAMQDFQKTQMEKQQAERAAAEEGNKAEAD